jgi:hypothetical protein
VTDSLRDVFPQLYRALLPGFFDQPAPREEKATCSSCAMCAPPGTPPGSESSYFRPDIKCCTYHPRLPNYLVGGLLSDPDPALAEGRRRVEEVIAGRIGVTPRWVAPPRKTRVLYHAARRSSFGRSLLLRCPYYQEQGGLCTIWRWRETDCSTFFCKYMTGADGQTFWRSLNGYLHEVQGRLAAHALARLAPELEEPAVEAGELTLDDLEDRPPGDYGQLWGPWQGREGELYRACYREIASLDEARFAEIAGAEAAERLAHLERVHGQMVQPALPERLVLSPQLTSEIREDGVLVSTYCDYDPMMLSPALFQLLQRFSAPTAVADTQVRDGTDEGSEIPHDLLVMLFQMRVLVAPEA